MNRQQRRHQPKNLTSRDTMQATPHYEVDYKVHLPADPPWRLLNHNSRRVVTAAEPIALWRSATFDLLQLLGFAADPTLTVGALLEIINRMPDEMREALMVGIAEGRGLTLTASQNAIQGDIAPKFTTLSREGVKRTPSGLVIP